MLSEDIEDRFNNLTELDHSQRKEEEISLICILVEALEKITLSSQEWQEIVCYSRELEQENRKGCLYKLIVERAPTEQQANDYSQHFLANNLIDEAKKNRHLWQNIIEHEKIVKEAQPIRSTFAQKKCWQKLSKIINPARGSRRHALGKSLNPLFWQEAYNAGQYAKVDEKWLEVWKKSKTTLSFVKWCTLVGIENKSVAYFNEEDRRTLQINFSNGKLICTSGTPLHTMKQRGSHLTSRVVDCVMALDETLYCYGTANQIEKEGALHHSGFLSGQPVLFAGELAANNGKLTRITLQSGHYQPDQAHLNNFLAVLYQNDINLSGVILIDGKGLTLSENALEFYQANQTHKNLPR